MAVGIQDARRVPQIYGYGSMKAGGAYGAFVCSLPGGRIGKGRRVFRPARRRQRLDRAG